MTGWSEEGLMRSWRALSRADAGAEWRWLRLTEIGGLAIEAGFHLMEKREALILRFPAVLMPAQNLLPQGIGFTLQPIDLPELHGNGAALALVRREGAEDVFALIVIDLLRRLEAASPDPADGAGALLAVALERLGEWQDFMARSRRPLSQAAQAALMAELHFLRILADTGLGAAALACWQGPLKSGQDFLIEEGAVEVKSTLKSDGFLAHIHTIEQLDTDRDPFFLFALRQAEDPAGETLAERVAALRARFAPAGHARAFEARLLLLGWQPEHAQDYTLRLSATETRILRIGAEFPCLRRADLPQAVTRASWQLDLDQIEAPRLELSTLLAAFGLTATGPALS